MACEKRAFTLRAPTFEPVVSKDRYSGSTSGRGLSFRRPYRFGLITPGESWYTIQIMTKLSRDDVLKLARLARLDITEEEIELYRKELSSILQYVEQIQNTDVTGLKPTTQVTGLTNVMRNDEVEDYGVSSDELLRQAPAVQDRQLKVKRMIK